jgi:oligosaccharide repeat unit polymerase
MLLPAEKFSRKPHVFLVITVIASGLGIIYMTVYQTNLAAALMLAFPPLFLGWLLFRYQKSYITLSLTLIFLLLLSYYMLDSIHFLLSDRASFALSDKTFSSDTLNYVFTSFYLMAVGLVTLLGISLASRGGSILPGFSTNFLKPQSSWLNFWGVLQVWIVTLLLSIALLVRKILELGGFAFYWDNIGARAFFFADSGLTYFLIQLPSYALLPVAIIFFLDKPTPLRKIVFTVAIVATCLLLALLGARAPILRTLLWVFTVHNLLSLRPIRLRFKFVVVLLVLLYVFIAFRLLTRTDQHIHWTEILNPLTMLNEVFDSVENSYAENLFLITDQPSLDYIRLNGSTLIAGVFWPLSVLNRDVPLEGGNEFFTRHFWPERWDRSLSELAIGGLNDVFLNFGWVGVLVAMFFISYCVRSLDNFTLSARERVGLSPLLIYFYCGVQWALFQFIRGDFFNTSVGFYLHLLALCFLLPLFFIRSLRWSR